MSALDLQEEIDRFQADLPIERAWMPPSSWYTTQAFHALEQTAVFANSWQPVARIEDLTEPGAFTSGVLAKQPWLLLRTPDGELRAYHNTCRHKGREVMQGCGRADELVCGYHAWAYDHDGHLKRAPQMAGVQEFDRAEMSLVPIRTATWGLWIFLHLGEDPPPLADQMGELETALGSPPWTALRHHSSQTWKLECNWKVVCDNYLDGGYHIPHMHPSLDAQLDMHKYTTTLHESFSVQEAPAASTADERIEFDAAQRIGAAARYAWIYPNWMINRYGACLDTNLVVPRGPDRCEVHYEFFFLSDGSEGALDSERTLEESIAQSAVTQREDIAICESVQRGLASASYDTGRYAPQVEIGEHHFHCLLASGLKRGLAVSD